MSNGRPKANTPPRDVTEVGKGDYVKIGSHWERIKSNTAAGAERLPRSWTVTTETGGSYDMYGVNAYAKAEDFE